MCADISKENEEGPIFQYYSVVNVANPDLGESSVMQTDDDAQPILFLTIGQDEEPEAAKEEEEDEPLEESAEDDSESNSFLSNLRLITLEDGRMFVTTANDRKFLKGIH